MIHIATTVLAVLMLASILGIARSPDHPNLDKWTARISLLCANTLALPGLLYLSYAYEWVWLLPFFGLLQLSRTSLYTHSSYAEFLLQPLIAAEVYVLLFFEGIRTELEGWPLLFSIVSFALLFEGLRRALESVSLRIGRAHWK